MRTNKSPFYRLQKNCIVILLLAVTSLIVTCKKTSSLATVSLSKEASSANHFASGSQPNIIFIVGDDVGYEIPTCNGGESYSTPTIDFLAQNGTRFTQCYSSANCSPSRFMLLTGKYNFRNYTQWGVMSRGEHTVGNMLQDAGYASCYVGKWQLDGGDTSIRTFGFNKYCVWLPYLLEPEESGGSKYKSPPIYQNGAFLPPEETLNKYSVDIFTDYALDFIEGNKEEPFFLYYALPLCHRPFTPTPDNPLFETWNFRKSDESFFPEMVSYMDKQIRLLMNKIDNLGLTNNTVYIFIGDNGTPKGIKSKFKGEEIEGEKNQTTTYGTHVPLIVNWAGHITSNNVTGQLVDLTDIMPTLADIAGIPVPVDYGVLDGKTFSPVLTGSPFSERDYVFNHYQLLKNGNDGRIIRYVQDSVYKYYEVDKFFNMVLDVHEEYPIPNSQLTPEEKAIKQKFQEILSEMHN